MATPRNRSTRFEDHKALVYKYALTYYRRLASQVSEANFDDVHGELSVAFVKAAEGYDRESEFTFTAYLTRCMQTHFNKYARRLNLEQYGSDDGTHSTSGLRCISIYELGTREDGEAAEDAWAFLPDNNCPTASDYSELLRDFNAVINDSTLLPETRVYIAHLANPDLQLNERTIDRIKAAEPKVRDEIRKRWGVGSLNFTFDE